MYYPYFYIMPLAKLNKLHVLQNSAIKQPLRSLQEQPCLYSSILIFVLIWCVFFLPSLLAALCAFLYFCYVVRSYTRLKIFICLFSFLYQLDPSFMSCVFLNKNWVQDQIIYWKSLFVFFSIFVSIWYVIYSFLPSFIYQTSLHFHFYISFVYLSFLLSFIPIFIHHLSTSTNFDNIYLSFFSINVINLSIYLKSIYFLSSFILW